MIKISYLFAQNIDLRDTPYTGYTLPPQALPTKQKTERWKKACMDALDNIAMRQVSRKIIAFNDSFRILQGDFKYKDVANSSAFLTEIDMLRHQTKLKDDLKHFGFIEPIVNHLIGEYIKMPDPITIYADDPYSTNDYIQVKTDALQSSVNQQVENMLNMKMIKQGINPFEEEFSTQEEQDAYLQQITQFKEQNSPVEIQKHMNQNWRAVYIEWAEATLKSDYSNFDIDEKDRISLYHYLAVGQCFRHFMMGYDYYEPENWHPTETFNDDTVINVEDGEYVGQLRYVPGNEMVSKWGHLFSEEQKIAILRSKYHEDKNLPYYKGTSSNDILEMTRKGGGNLHAVPWAGHYPYQNGKWMQDQLGVDLGFKEDFPNNQYASSYYTNSERTDLIKYVFGYWVSHQRIGYLTLFDEQIGELTTQKVTDEILKEFIKEYGIKQLHTVSLEQHEKDPKPNTIVWDYLPQVWKGLKVCKENTDLDEDLYLGIEPLEYQLKGNSQEYHTKLPVVGINEQTSFVSRLEEEQKAYSILMNMAIDYAEKELGIFFLMDFSLVPSWLSDIGGEDMMLKFTDVIRNLGIAPIDGEFSKSSFNQWTSINMDLTQAMLGKLEAAQVYKRLAFEKVGFSPERLGMPTPNNKTATGVNQATNASYNQTEVWFDKFAKFQKRYNETHINIAQYLKKEGVDGTVNLVDSYQMRTFINMSDPNLPMRRFRIQPEANTKRRSELEILKQVYINDNTIMKDLESLGQVLSADSTVKVIQLARYNRQLAQIEQEKLQQQELQKIQENQKGEFDREEAQRQFDREQNALDRKKEILKAQIVALGFDKDEGGKEIIDETNRALDSLKITLEERRNNLDRQDKKLSEEKQNRLKEKELLIKEREAITKERAVTIPLEVAQENLTSAEIQAKHKAKADSKKKKTK